ncbi:hypothetical protein B4119_0958 [Parageobacillus caldoxylosilyticus]|nr:hypothetical protein B4119_0958 [Parageobacillus caldoxylosilyticus]
MKDTKLTMQLVDLVDRAKAFSINEQDHIDYFPPVNEIPLIK